MPTINERVANLEKDMTAMKTNQSTMQSTLDKVSGDTETILEVLNYGKTGATLLKKWWPRIGTLIIGYALARGWITSDIAQLLRGL